MLQIQQFPLFLVKETCKGMHVYSSISLYNLEGKFLMISF